MSGVSPDVIGWFRSPQSAALQKKLRHLEVQLNNEKQVKDEMEHKYRAATGRLDKLSKELEDEVRSNPQLTEKKQSALSIKPP